MAVTTARKTIRRALRLIGVLGAGREPTQVMADDALEALQSLVLSLSTWWTDVDIDADYTAGENERVRVTTTDAVLVTIPASVSSAERLLYCCNQIQLLCQGFPDRAPSEFARVQVTDASSDATATYYYRPDIAQWTRADALTLDSEVPWNAALDEGFACLLAVRLAPEYDAAIPQVVAVGAARCEQRLDQLLVPNLRMSIDPAFARRRSREAF